MRVFPAYQPALLFDKRRALRLAALSLALLFCWPVILLLHEASIADAAGVLRALLQSDMVQWLVARAGIDTVYASVVIQMAGNIQIYGISVAGPIGDALHRYIPSVFAGPESASNGAWVSAVFQAGSPLLARAIISIFVAGVFIYLGLALTQWTISRRNDLNKTLASVLDLGTLLVGIMFQARGVETVLSLPITAPYLEMIGLPQFLTKVIRLSQGDYFALMSAIAPIVPIAAPVVLLLGVYASSLFLIVFMNCLLLEAVDLASSFSWYSPRKSSSEDVESSDIVHSSNRRLPYFYAALVVLIVLSSTTIMSIGMTNYDYASIIPDDNTSREATGVAPGAKPAQVVGQPHLGPSVVSIAGSNFAYEYTVNGTRQRIRGVGYNAQYKNLPTEARIAAYSKDFRAMKSAGFNTILGWDQSSFDHYTLAVASQYDLGVVLPYSLPNDVDYLNPNVCKKLKDDVLAWVNTYKKDPALRMWGIGNEVLHDMRFGDRRKAFADFYRDLADSVHQIDPDHPIMYREAEDAFVPIIKNSLANDKTARPWLVYGMNIFTYRLKNVLADWRKVGIDVPVVVSEFAPSGLQPRDRPAGYVKMWGMLQDYRSLVIGGFMYVWTTAGPEPLDRVYGLVDENGNPVDGTLQTMANQFLSDKTTVD